MVRQREDDHNQMLKRYQNVKKEIDSQQSIERIKLDKALSVQEFAKSNN